MAEKKDKALKWLAAALEMEERGNSFYQNAVKECQNEVGREIFDMLRKDELMHMKRINNIYDSLESGKGWTDKWKAEKFQHGDLAEIFTGLAEKHVLDIKPLSTDLDAMGVGVDLEHSSIKFYKKHLANAGQPKEKKFLEQMVEEEQAHLDALLDMKDYLTDPAAWHFKKERHLPV